MTIYARIFDGEIVEIFKTEEDISKMFHPDFIWAEIEDGATPSVGWKAKKHGDIWNFDSGISSESDSVEILAAFARQQRNQLLRDVYDPAIIMAQRSQRAAKTDEDKATSEARISVLDKYATDLQNIPVQKGFPKKINWPKIPDEIK